MTIDPIEGSPDKRHEHRSIVHKILIHVFHATFCWYHRCISVKSAVAMNSTEYNNFIHTSIYAKSNKQGVQCTTSDKIIYIVWKFGQISTPPNCMTYNIIRISPWIYYSAVLINIKWAPDKSQGSPEWVSVVLYGAHRWNGSFRSSNAEY